MTKPEAIALVKECRDVAEEMSTGAWNLRLNDLSARLGDISDKLNQAIGVLE